MNLSCDAGFIPIVGTAQSVYEVVTGRDLITGEEVHRGMALIGVLPGGRLIRAAAARGIDDLIPVQRRLPAPEGILTKPTASIPELQRTIEDLFQPTDKLVGGTAGAVRYERASGKPVNGKFHSIKAEESISRINNIKHKYRSTLSQEDKDVADLLIADLRQALDSPEGIYK